jgi:hypothetical protein
MMLAEEIVRPLIFSPFGQKTQPFGFCPHPPTIGISAVDETKCFAKNVKGDLIDNPN